MTVLFLPYSGHVEMLLPHAGYRPQDRLVAPTPGAAAVPTAVSGEWVWPAGITGAPRVLGPSEAMQLAVLLIKAADLGGRNPGG